MERGLRDCRERAEKEGRELRCARDGQEVLGIGGAECGGGTEGLEP